MAVTTLVESVTPEDVSAFERDGFLIVEEGLVSDRPSLDESFFPILWEESGYRTPWLAELPAIDS